MIKLIDNFLNKITMYRIVLYSLIVLILYAVALSFLGILNLSPYSIIFSTFFILTVSLASNQLFAYICKAPTNTESVYITALILVFIISPITAESTTDFFILAGIASLLSMASKYILAIKKKHLFNPVAIAVVVTELIFGFSASWWVATFWMMPVVIITGLLITRKTQRFDLVLSFFLSSLLVIFFRFSTSNSSVGLFSSFTRAFISSPILFFAFFMLTEPLTTPHKSSLRVTYGWIVGLLFSPIVHIGSLYSTPELALVVGNVFSYLVSPKQKLMLVLNNVKELARDTYEFSFTKDRGLNFKPGQYMEFTLKDDMSDSRGNRRYFTLASSPTEEFLSLGVKYYPKPSSFKNKLLEIGGRDVLVAAQLSGEFVLPKDVNKKLVFIAGGIGITPFRSMIKFLLDTKQKRDIVMFYSNRTKEDIAYREIFNQAKKELDIKTIYTLTDAGQFATKIDMINRPIDKKLILQNVPDYQERTYYISGPNSMVDSFKSMLTSMGVPRRQIKTDFFPGFA
jgi:ferredoxin-NADP reductase